ncbi:PRC-barrel domain-containing protein [Mesobacillus subterraneus]|uniref:PRC-barrel domain-containing protein n=1 Tax=Mesobacillus subterraneus TaxID=285983 RepID=UPI0020412C76|nr:PRC-barrel domain-containing protein [Mesobacillus subterraneus]MCM3663892.1 PRC-barrel domain-containing protein [Mesobacillus subterraneus]MCM3683652.1 PRC-barrel domain-containing protein [Mesobacillus subterraneus]
MRTFSLLKGLPVYELASGQKLGEVCDMSISSNGSVVGLLVKKGAFIKKTFQVKVSQVASFGWDGVMVKDKTALQPLETEPEYTFEHNQSLAGKKLLSNDGEQLGLLEDVYFMEELGTIVGYELTDGFFSDITNGKRVVKTIGPPAIGKDAIIVTVKSR